MLNYEPLNHLPPIRRLVTGHSPMGHAIVHRDEMLTPVGASTSLSGAGFTLIYRTDGFPVSNQGKNHELKVENLQRSKHPLGIVCEVVEIPPGTNSTKSFLDRNHSLDYGVVLSGSIVLELEDGAETELHPSDIFIQRGTTYAWKNVTEEYCRFMVVIVPAQPVVIDASGAVLGVSKIAGLTD